MDITLKLKFKEAVKAAAKAVADRQEEINKLNVFPIPDGDTGTNVTLTMQNVVRELDKLDDDVTMTRIFRALKRGSLMGARGNSGVITSQILRGVAEGATARKEFDSESIAHTFECARDVAYQAVRKPVEGTILTVISDVAAYTRDAYERGVDWREMLQGAAREAMASVKRTPELMPMLKENGVVDSGGLALAVMLGGFVDSFLGTSSAVSTSDSVFQIQGGAKVAIEQVHDWDDHNFRYCTEFLFKSRELDVEEGYAFLEGIGDCQLIVGEHPDFKIHVHTDRPGDVLNWMIERGQPHEIFIHNMDMQSDERIDKIVADEGAAASSAGASSSAVSAASVASAAPSGPPKPLGFVAVSVGQGNAAILESLGVDTVVSGGQTNNPSTADIADAVAATNAEAVIVLPGNKNIVMSANSAASFAKKPCAVVPTKSIIQTFSAMFAADPEGELSANVEAMTSALDGVVTCEITTAIKDAVADDGVKVACGDLMGIIDGAIRFAGTDRKKIVEDCIAYLMQADPDNITLLAGEDMTDDELQVVVDFVEESYPDVDVDAQRGGQPLYPLIIGAE